mmetsp:Transcript_15520/g.20479  ORF Transcript_15520/g.20479 Transcript_15520/m.20479 type:complete len:205 (-) Transcript_15520:134-748(-)
MSVLFSRTMINVYHIATGSIILLVIGNNPDFEIAMVYNIKSVSHRALFDDPITLLTINLLHDAIDHFTLFITNVLEHDRRTNSLCDTSFLFLCLFCDKLRQFQFFLFWVLEVSFTEHLTLSGFERLRFLFREMSSDRTNGIFFNRSIGRVILVNKHHLIVRGHFFGCQFSRGDGLKRHRSLWFHLIQEHANYGDIVGTEFILQP